MNVSCLYVANEREKLNFKTRKYFELKINEIGDREAKKFYPKIRGTFLRKKSKYYEKSSIFPKFCKRSRNLSH
jgi:hypothetical protein